jgi:transposase
LERVKTKIKSKFSKALQESEYLKGRSKIAPRSSSFSSSSSSSSSRLLLSNVRNIGFNYGIGPDELPADDEDQVMKYHDWNTFQEKLDATEEQKAGLRQQIREARAAGLPVPKNIYPSYPAESLKSLAQIINLKIEESNIILN